jgi:hypothetical protein
MAREWLSTCRNEHNDCNSRYDNLRPSRLLDIRGATVKLMLQSENPTTVPYAALSHCWGNAQPLRTLSTTIAHFQQGISTKILPQTFLDAIFIARSLDFQYLWIDSLCIVQDSVADWEEQSSMMASIYSNADLVLGASAAASASEGFLGARYPYREGNVAVQVNGAQTTFVYRLLHHHIYSEEPLDKRGWALQERLCAQRFLSYGKWEMLWECKRICCSESERSLLKPDASPGNFQAELEKTAPWDFGNCWRRRVASPYGTRMLTKDTDMPVAISALAARFQSRFNGTYLSGLWKEDLIFDLQWYTMPQRCAGSFYAPSWSWMSIEAGRNLVLSDGDLSPVHERSGETRHLADVLEAKLSPSTLNVFGPVSSSSIILAGVLIPKYTIEPTSGLGNSSCGKHTIYVYTDVPLVRVNVQPEDGSETNITRRALRHEHSTETSFPVMLLPLVDNQEFNEAHGLLLGRSTISPGAFERLGIFNCLPLQAFEEAKRDHGVREIVLV